MKNKFDDKQVEDILSEDALVERIKRSDLTDSPVNTDEYDLAAKIYQVAGEKKNTLGNTQKELLGKRITRTINAARRKKLILRYSSAAVLALIIGISAFFQTNKSPDIEVFVLNNSSVEYTGSTKLILSGEKEIEINTDETNIEYAGNGNDIKIDAAQDVRQVVGHDNLILNTLVVPYGKRAHITLSDNSTIWLNSGSKLIYPAKFAADKREVYLEGEALFEVSHNKECPFRVLTPDVEVKVLGTVFNLSAYKDDQTINTVLESGSVELKYKSKSIFGPSKVKMVPGMLAEYNPDLGTVEQTRVNTKYYTSWRDGYFIFEKEPLGIILKKISRYYNVSIKLDSQKLAEETFSGQLDLQNSANRVMEIIAEIISAKVENTDNQIIITRK